MPEGERPVRILFLCTRNSCRSQMAEGWARHLKKGAVEPYSAGLKATRLDPLAVRAMAQAGIDISDQKSKRMDELADVRFDWVVTVCGEADRNCPYFPNASHRMHRGFDDPPGLAAGAGTEAEALEHYCRVRDEIRGFIEQLPDILNEP